MELTNILIFVLIGAVCLVVVTGGFLSMTNTEVSPGYLAAGAALGGVAGGLFGPSISSGEPVDASKILSALSSSTSGAPEMKIGLPAF